MLADPKSMELARLQQGDQDPVDEIASSLGVMSRVLDPPLTSAKRRGAAWLRLREAIRCNLATLYPEILAWVGVSPVYANLRITHRCSAKCKSCQHWMESSDRELTTEEWKTILLNLRKGNFLGVSLTGGDILMRSDFLDLLHFSNGIGLSVHVTLNGFTLTEPFAKELMKAEPSTIYLSYSQTDWIE